jgi:MFS family permease
MLPAVLDQTILATGLPTIAAISASLADLSWVVTATWSPRRPRRLCGESSATGTVASRCSSSRCCCSGRLRAVCGAAQDITQLIVLRVAQGGAAGGLMTLAMASVGDLVAPRERGRYQGYIAATFAVATVVGPLLGGGLVEGAGWRWVFLVNLPVGAAALVLLARRLPAAPVEGGAPAARLAGAALLAGATTALMLACVWAASRYPWESAQVLGLFGVAAAVAAGLVVREPRAADPIVPLSMLRSRSVAVASAALFLATGSLFAVTVFVPLFLQTAPAPRPPRPACSWRPRCSGSRCPRRCPGG